MIESIIRWSVGNRFFVLLATLILLGWGLFSLKNTPVDAIPELAEIQKIGQQLEAILKEVPGTASVYSIAWSGQYEYMQRAKEKLTYVIPLTLAIIVVLLFINFRNLTEVAIIMGTLPLAMVGSVWLMYWQGFNFSIAVGVGFIALAGVAVEIGVIMLVYLNQAWREMLDRCADHKVLPREETLRHAVLHGAGLRVRPVMMTAAAIIIGLLPILYGSGTGSEVMSRIAAPMVGGMVSAVVLTLLVLPAVYYLWRRRTIRRMSLETPISDTTTQQTEETTP